MDIIGWILIGMCFVIAFVGLVYPIIPSALFIFGGFLLYGVFFTFNLPWWFWTAEVMFLLLLFGADMLSNAFGVKRFGGSKAGVWGSTIGLLIGPFVIPGFGILIGPFAGAVIAELIVTRSGLKQSIRTGIGSLIGFLTSIVTKGAVQTIMIILFFMAV